MTATNQRRSVFGTTSQADLVPDFRSSSHTLETPVPITVVDQLNFAETKRKTATHRPRAGQVSYRGFPEQLKGEVQRIAGELGVSCDEVARAALEYALGKVWSGQLILSPSPARVKMTLYPPNRESIKPSGQIKRAKGKKVTSPRWKAVVTFRGIPLPLQVAVKKIAGDHDLPIGEVAAFLVEYGTKAYQAGELVLRPVPRAGANTLFGD